MQEAEKKCSMKYEPHCSADCFNWDLAGNFFFCSLSMCLSRFPSARVGCVCNMWVGQKLLSGKWNCPPSVPGLWKDLGTGGNDYDRSVLRTVFHSAFPTLLSTCLHTPLSFFLSLPLSSFSLSEDGECWSIGVSSSFGLFLLRDLL